MYKLVLTIEAKKKLKEIKKIYQSAVTLALEELRDDPLSGKPLKEKFSGQLAIRVGVYRIVYKVNTKDKTVTVITAKHRAIVYQ